MKRVISAVLAVCLMLSAFSVFCFAGESEYWAAQKAYLAAVESGNKDALIAAVKMIEKAYPNPSNSIEYGRVATPLLKAAGALEEKLRFDEAIAYYKKYLKYITWLEKNAGLNYYDHQLNIPKTIEHLSVQPEIYAATTKTVVDHKAINEPAAGTYFGVCGTNFDLTKQSALLRYTNFPKAATNTGGEYFASRVTSYDQLQEGGFLEIAWNLSDEDLNGLNAVNGTKFDKYIDDNIKQLGDIADDRPDIRIMLRFGAEVNNWNDNTTKSKQVVSAFKSAYIKIAKKVRALKKTNIALVYSPNDINNRMVTAADFYPGDSYVDWVGISSYYAISPSALNSVNSTDAYYCRGYYENPMIRVKEIIETFGTKKPIMISECGFAYATTASGDYQTQAHAVQKMKEFYTYINMVYPCVKAVLYFDQDTTRKYSLGGNATVQKTFNSLVKSNESMASSLTDTGKTYTKLDNFKEVVDSLTLNAYAYYPVPSSTTVTCTWYLDGKKVASQTAIPYSYKLSVAGLKTGKHTVAISVKCGSADRTVVKVLNKAENGTVTCTNSLRDVPPTHWAYKNIDYCLRGGIFGGTSFATFEPETVMTRAMFVQVLANISGANTRAYKTSAFSDVRIGDWYGGAVMWAYSNKIVSGIGKGTFRPNDSVTREQMCVMLYNFAAATKTKLPATQKAVSFADTSRIGSWAKTAVTACQRAGIISGMTENGKAYFKPQAGASRCQACTVFRLYDGIAK